MYSGSWLSSCLGVRNLSCETKVDHYVPKAFVAPQLRFRDMHLRTFAGTFSSIDFFLRLLPLKVDELVMSEM